MEMKKARSRKQSIEFVIDVPIGSLRDEPEDDSRVLPTKRRYSRFSISAREMGGPVKKML